MDLRATAQKSQPDTNPGQSVDDIQKPAMQFAMQDMLLSPESCIMLPALFSQDLMLE